MCRIASTAARNRDTGTTSPAWPKKRNWCDSSQPNYVRVFQQEWEIHIMLLSPSSSTEVEEEAAQVAMDVEGAEVLALESEESDEDDEEDELDPEEMGSSDDGDENDVLDDELFESVVVESPEALAKQLEG